MTGSVALRPGGADFDFLLCYAKEAKPREGRMYSAKITPSMLSHDGK